MYDVQALQTAYTSLVGVRQSNIPGVPDILPPLSDSISGIYVEDKSPLATTENMYYSAPNFEPSVYPKWISGSNYKTGNIISDIGIIYKAKSDILADTVPPASDSTNWDVYNPFNSFLSKKVNQSVPNLFSKLVTIKKLDHMGKAINERLQLYRGFGALTDKIIPKGRFLGFAIYPQQAEGLWVFIDMVGIQATQINPNFKFYLYHSDSDTYIEEWDTSITLVKTFSWFDLTDGATPPKLNAIMKYLSRNTSGFYMFGYYEDDVVSGNIIQKKWDCTSAPCIGCNSDDLNLYNQWSRYTSIRTISVPASALNNDRTLFDISQIQWDTVTNWGMNLSLTIRCDLTDLFIYSKNLIADAFAYQICKEFLSSIANGIRLGPNPAQTKLSAIAELDPKTPGNTFIKDYNDVIQALNLDFSGFSAACLPCEKTKRIEPFVI